MIHVWSVQARTLGQPVRCQLTQAIPWKQGTMRVQSRHRPHAFNTIRERNAIIRTTPRTY